MNFAQLLHQREQLLREARLANLAFAHQRLSAFAERIDRAQLRGLVTVEEPDPAAECFWPTLLALEGSQAVLDEHFLDEEVLELAEILAFLRAEGEEVASTFRIEELPQLYLPAIERALEGGGVKLPARVPRPEDSNRASG